MAETDRVNGLIGTLGIKAPVRAATTGPVTAVGAQTVDGVALVAGDRVLRKDEADTTLNGIYDVQSGAWARSPDFDGARDVVKGTSVNVNEGTVNAITQWRVTSANPNTPGTTSITFAVSATAFGADIAALTHATTLKALPVGADEFPIWDSVSASLRRLAVSSLRSDAYVFDGFTKTQQDDVLAGTETLDVRAAIQTQINALETAGGGVLDLPRGTYSIGAALVLPAKVYLRGAGSANTVIKLRPAANSNVLQTKDFATLTLQNKWSVSEGVPTGFGFDGIRFDGNRANQTVAGGVAIYGKKYHIGYDVQIVKCKGVGFYSECAYKGGEAVPDDQPEGYIGKLQVWESGQENVIYRGPHDQPIGDIYSALAGQDGVYDGVVFDGKINVYQGITYVNGTVHSYASTGNGVVCKTQMMFNKLSGESNYKSGVIFETSSANWIGAFYTNVNYLEGYGNDSNLSGLYWNFENRVTGTNIGLCRHSVSKASAGSIYNTGHGLTIAAGVIVGAGAQNGTAFKNNAEAADVNLKIYNYNNAADVAFNSVSSAHCHFALNIRDCYLSWLNSGTSLYNDYKVDASSNVVGSTAFSNTGTMAGTTDTYSVKLVHPGFVGLSQYNDIQRAIPQAATSVTVTHNGFKTPTAGEISVTPIMDWAYTYDPDGAGADTAAQVPRSWWVANITATTFDLVTNVAAPVGGLIFLWKLDI